MTLPDFRRRARLSQSRLAEMLTEAGFPATQTLISQWESGDVVIPPERCAQLERVTSGGITRLDLRPDIFGDLELEQDSDHAASATISAPLPERFEPRDDPHGAEACPRARARA